MRLFRMSICPTFIVRYYGIAHADVQVATLYGCAAQLCATVFQVCVLTVKVQQTEASVYSELWNEVEGVKDSVPDIYALYSELPLEDVAEVQVHHHCPRVQDGVVFLYGGKILQFYVQQRGDAHLLQTDVHARFLRGYANGFLYRPVLDGGYVQKHHYEYGKQQHRSKGDACPFQYASDDVQKDWGR